MDRYAKREQERYVLREQIVEDIRSTLTEKGYNEDETIRVFGSEYRTFEMEYDRLLINGKHTDNCDTDFLLGALRVAMHLMPN